MNVKGAQRRPWQPVAGSRVDVTEWQGFVYGGGSCPRTRDRERHSPPVLSPHASSHPQVSPPLTLDGPYSLGTQEGYQGAENQDQLHTEYHCSGEGLLL